MKTRMRYLFAGVKGQMNAMLRVTPRLLCRLRPHFVAGMAAQQSRSRSLASSTAARTPIKNVAVIGSGLMGSGIAQVNRSAI